MKFDKNKTVTALVKEKKLEILKHLHPDFNLDLTMYPKGICDSCFKLYSKHENGKVVTFPEFPNYKDMILPKETRQNPSPECNCYICITARDKTRKSKYVYNFMSN